MNKPINQIPLINSQGQINQQQQLGLENNVNQQQIGQQESNNQDSLNQGQQSNKFFGNNQQFPGFINSNAQLQQ